MSTPIFNHLAEPKEEAVPNPGEDVVNHPSHYKAPNPRFNLQVIDVIEAWNLDEDHYLATAVAYILRAKYKGRPVQDVLKAVWYLTRWAKNHAEK